MSLYEFVDELGRTIRSGRLRAVGGTVGDVPTQQADHSLSQSPGGGSQTLGIKDPCAVAAWDSITLSGLQTIDFYAVQEGDRVLVLSQDDATENGIYVASAGAWMRATDANAVGQIMDGTLVPIEASFANASASGLFSLVSGSSDGSWTPGTDTLGYLMIAGSHLMNGASLDSGNTLEATMGAAPYQYQGQQLKNLADPTDPQDAATKAYVDTKPQANYAGGAVTITNGANGQPLWETLASGTELLDRTDQANPVFLAAGTYAVQVSVQATAAFTSGGSALVSMSVGAANADAMFTTLAGGPGSAGPSAVTNVQAGDAILLLVTNGDGAVSRDFLLGSATIVKIA